MPAPDVAVVRQMLAKALHAPLAHGAGRWFDALGALAGDETGQAVGIVDLVARHDEVAAEQQLGLVGRLAAEKLRDERWEEIQPYTREAAATYY